MTTHRNAPLVDPRHSVITKPLSIPQPSGEHLSGEKLSREQVFWDNYHRRQRQWSRQGYRAAAWRPYEVGEPLYLEPKRLILQSLLGQPEDEASKDDVSPEEDVPINTDPLDSPAGSKSLPFRLPQARKRQDAISLQKHLGHTRRLVSAVKHGRSYFHLLQKEEQEEEEAQQRERQRREAWHRTEPRPPCSDSDSDSDSDRWPLAAGASWSSGARPGRKKTQSARPFTPIHRSLTSPQLSEASQEPIFRQLCCLNWLLEALTLDRTGRPGPVTSCWDSKDPGRGRTTVKTVNKERAIQTKWEQFVTLPKPRRAGSRPPKTSSSRLYSWKSSSLSVASSSVLASPAQGSLASLFPGTEDTAPAAALATAASQDSSTEPPGAGDSETELPTSEYLQKLLDAVHHTVTKELCNSGQLHGNSPLTERQSLPAPRPISQRMENPKGPRTAVNRRAKRCPANPLSASSQLISSKWSMVLDLRAAFEDRAEEHAQSFSDTLEHNARKRLDSGIQRFQALRHVTHAHRVARHVTSTVTEVKAPQTDTTERPCNNNNIWLASLLSGLPADVARDNRGVSRVLEKLGRFADEGTPKVRPQLFLKVLGGLQPWELCLPDLCVAIEIAREHVVQMPREDYDTWLCSRVTLPQPHPQQDRGAPHMR